MIYLPVLYVIFIPPSRRLSWLFSTLKIFCHPFTGAFCKFLGILVDAFRNSRATSGPTKNSFLCFVPPVISIQNIICNPCYLQLALVCFSQLLFFSSGFVRQPLCNIFPGY